jgi:hypothetical protein
MLIKKSTLVTAANPNTYQAFEAIFQNDIRSRLHAAAPAAMVNNSGAAAGGPIVAPPALVQTAQNGANLAQFASFNTAIATVDDAIAVLASWLKTYFYTPYAAGNVTLNATGVITAAGTVPAVTVAVTAVDGTAGDAALRSEVQAALTGANNNLATVIRMYNNIAVALGFATIADNSGGAGDPNLTLYNQSLAVTAVAAANVATSDLAPAAGVDTALTDLADNISYVTAQINASIFNAAALAVTNPLVLLP